MSVVNRLAFAIVDFLEQQVHTGAISGDALESVEVALQCIQSAYGINTQDPALAAQLKTERSLLEIFTAAVGGQQPDVTQGAASFTPASRAAGDGEMTTGQAASSSSSSPPEAEPTEQDKDHAEKLKNEGNDCMRKDRYSEAIKLYTRAINLNPNKAVYYSNRAAAYSKLENHERALQDCQKAVTIDPTYSKAYGRMGLAYSSMQEYQKAYEAYTRAVDLEPGNSSYQTNLEIAEHKLKEANLGGGGGGGQGSGPNVNLGGLGAGLGNMDVSSLLNNPAIMDAASSFLQDPNMQQMLQSFMGQAMQPGAQADQSQSMANLLSVGQRIATQIQTTNPELVEQVRQIRTRMNDGNSANNNQEGTDGDNQQPPPPAQ